MTQTPRWIPAALGAALLVAGWPGAAEAQVDPTTDLDNTCTDAGGMGAACANDEDCASRAFATRCVQLEADDPASRRCQVPCEAEGGGGDVDATRCALGEGCAESPGDGALYCKPARFRMDLNLLDQCVAHFIEGTPPVLGQRNACSLEANLARLLDQDGDLDFDIIDVGLCVRAFLEQPVCDPDSGQCPAGAEDLRFCEDDDECGEGLYCDGRGNHCTRECGLVAAREVGFTVLERGCSGRFKRCDFSRGRCEEVDPAESACQVDGQCPEGAYCFLGQCAPECNRGIDCPDSSWFCADNSQCRVQPAPDGDPGFVFEPKNYAILFGTGSLTLNAIEDEQAAPLLVMDLTTKREVRNNPSVGFGYRLEVTYAFKQEKKCFESPDDWSAEDRDDCLIDPSEEFVTPLAPFGTVFAAGRPEVAVRLDAAAASRLTPGAYVASVNAIFDNGSQDRFMVHYDKLTPSGEYAGTLTVALGRPENTLEGRTPLGLAMKLHIKEEQTRWNELLADNNLVLAGGEDIIDLTRGRIVHGELLANRSLPFALPGARGPGDNRIPIKGIYSPRSGQMRLIGVVDLPADFCLGEDGPCGGVDDGVTVTNDFGRDVRRVFQLAGTYEEASRRYFGIYRERITGLVPGEDLTLDGAFLLEQTEFDPSEFTLEAPLVADGAEQVAFPTVQGQLAELDAQIVDHCEALHPEFDDAGAYAAYLAGDGFPVLDDLITFEALISEALIGLPDDREAEREERILTLYDYLAGWIVPCDRDDPGALADGGDTACVDEDKIRCGLALHRKALLKGYVLASDVGDGEAGDLPLFCSSVIPVQGCEVDADTPAALTTLWEHNRFHQELSQALKFHADRSLSDAFFTLYRHRANPFVQGAALSFKDERLRSAFSTYGQLTELFLSPDAAGVLWLWPMERFQSRGNEWLRQMQLIITDRLEVQRQLVDLRRRLFANTDRSDQLFAEHLAQQEYLVQVYLMALQRHWQGEDFRSLGQGAEVFAALQGMLLQLHESKNPLGYTPDQVYFENSDMFALNWRNYLNRLVGEDGGGGLMARARDEVDEAVQNLQDSLRDVDALEDKIFEARQEHEDTLAELCGPEIMVDADTVCDRMLEAFADPAEFDPDSKLEKVCQEASFPDPFLGGFQDPLFSPDRPYGESCTRMVTMFRTDYDHSGAGERTGHCPLDAALQAIEIRGRKRVCVGGEMGRLAAERKAMLIDLGGLYMPISRAWEDLQAHIQGNFDEWQVASLKLLIEQVSALITWILGQVESTWDDAEKLANEILTGADCVLIAGMAVGTDCPQSMAVGAGKALTAVASTFAKRLLAAAQFAVELATALSQRGVDFKDGQRTLGLEIDGKLRDYGGALDNFGPDVQRIVNVQLQMTEILYTAQYSADRLDDTISMALDHLVGRETGSVLVGNQWVGRSAKTFSKMLETTYRMVMAYTHSFNLPADEATALVNRVYQAVTLDDLQALIDTVIEVDESYCGREAIDCDALLNVSTLRFSFLEELFPDLQDLVDPRTGAVVTRGEQFHNLITTPPYLRRRVRGNHVVDQIEVPFTVWLDKVGSGAQERWMVNPTQCNHIIESDPGAEQEREGGMGTVALNVVGQRVQGAGPRVGYELVRGHVDNQRACHAVPVVQEVGTPPVLDFPIERRIVGYAPQSVQGMQPAPPTYVTRSAELAACMGLEDGGGKLAGADCWKFFARDRSLAAPDWMLVIPLRIDGAATLNTWIVGDGLPEDERPLIEDLVLYLRYRSRPVQEY